MAKKNLARGVKHLAKNGNLKFIGAEVDEQTFTEFRDHAKSDGRSVSSLLRLVVKNFLGAGVKHPQ